MSQIPDADPGPDIDPPVPADEAKAPALPNRLVAVALAVLGLIAAIAPVVANLDWTSTVSVIAGLGVVAAAAIKWLDGWQKQESAQYQAQLISHKASVEIEVMRQEAAAAQSVGGRRSSPAVKVPRS
jgi:hypothetical protein